MSRGPEPDRVSVVPADATAARAGPLPRAGTTTDLSPRLREQAKWANLLVGLIALVGFIGWLADLPELTAIGEESPTMLPASVLALGLIALGLWALRTAEGRRRTGVALLAAGGVGGVALGALAIHFGFVSRDYLLLDALVEPAPISAGTAACYLMMGGAIALAVPDRQRSWASAQFLAAALGAVVLVALVGMSFRLIRFGFDVPWLGIALPVEIALLAACLALLLLRPDGHLPRILAREASGGLILRRLVPIVVVLPLVTMWIQALAERSGWLNSTQSEGVLTVATIVACVGLVVWMSGRLDEVNRSRAEAEARAATQREYMKTILANIGDAVVSVDHACRISFLNPAAEALLESSFDAAGGHALSELLNLVDAASGERLDCPLEAAFTTERAISLEGEPAVRHRDGHLQAVEVTATPIKDSGGQTIGCVMVLRDVGAKRAREHVERESFRELDRRVVERTRQLERMMSVLRESTALLSAIAASTPELIMAKSCDGRIILMNPAALKSLGLSRADVIGHTEAELFGQSVDTQRAAESDRRVIETGEPMAIEERHVLRDGVRTYLVTKSPLRDAEGRIFGVVSVAKDITERKRMQQGLERLLVTEHRLRGEAEQANRAKDEFLAIVSHELRSPLNALKGWSQVLSSAEQPDSGLVAHAAEAIKRNIDHQTRLIDDLLDTSRIISGKLELNLHRVNLVEVADVVLEAWKRAARDKQLDLRFDCKEEEIYVDGDFDRLQQVLGNLLSNAVKFTPEHGEVRVGLRKTAEGVELTVADNGIGIEDDFVPHVFDRFSQADSSMTRRHLGLGIGLALVRSLVELHGGAVKAASGGPEEGSTFIVTLPPPRQASEEVVGRDDRRQEDARMLAGVTALVVDDEPDNRDVFRAMLGLAGAQVHTFDSGEALLARWNTIAPLPARAVLLLDIAMPGVSGFEVLRQLRLDDDFDVPAIAITALTHFDDQRFAAAGFRSWLSKPVDRQDLLEAIGSVVGRAPARA